MALDYSLDWMRAIAAVKLGRSGLTCKWTAFSAAREFINNGMWPQEAVKSGYLPFPFPRSLNPTEI